jgi:MFS family permease
MNTAAATTIDGHAHEPSEKEVRLVIAASSAGTVFEWYDFFIYGTLAALIGAAFFPSDNETLELLLVWAGFAVGFGFRPLGAILFGYLGDKLGRKYTFLVTVTLMGVATAGVGLIPSVSSRDSRWAANTAARRSMSPNTRPLKSAGTLPATSRRAWSAGSC